MGKITIRYEDWTNGAGGRLTIFEEELDDNFTYEELRDHRYETAQELMSKDEFSDVVEVRTSTSATGFDSGSYVTKPKLGTPERYFDKNKNRIKAGMKIRHDDGDVELVYLSSDRLNLGVNASNENYPTFMEENREIYLLSEFNLNEWEIVDEEK